MNKKQAQDLLYISDKCSECKTGRMKVVEGIINIGNWFLRCDGCGYEYDD